MADVLVHLAILVPQPREFRLSQAVSKALVVHFLLQGVLHFLQVFKIRGSRHRAAVVSELSQLLEDTQMCCC